MSKESVIRNILRASGRWGLLILLCLYLTRSLPTTSAQTPLTTVRYTNTGNLAYVAASVGMQADSTNPATVGTVTLNVPGTPVAAFLYWAGVEWRAGFAGGGGDNQVDFAVDGGPVTALTADQTYTQNWIYAYGHFVYVEDVTAAVLSGSHNYSVSNFVMDAGAQARRLGVGLIAVYSDPGLPVSQVIIIDGLNSFIPGSNPSVSPSPRHSAGSCVSFPALATARTLNYTMLVGDITAGPPERTHALWAETGTGAPPGNLFDTTPLSPLTNLSPDAQRIAGPATGVPDAGNPSPFSAAAFTELGTYTPTGLPVPANDEYGCFQIQTFSNVSPETGASGLWLALASAIPLAQPAAPTVAGPEIVAPNDPSFVKWVNPPEAAPGQTVRWTMAITNDTNDTYINSVLVDDAVDGTYFAEIIEATASKGTATINGLNVHYDIGDMAPGEVVTLTLVTRLRSDLASGATATNTATITIRSRPPRSVSASVNILGAAVERPIEELPATGYAPGAQQDSGGLPPWVVPAAAGVLLLLIAGISSARRRS